MGTQCNRRSFRFKHLHRRRVTARFDGGAISSDGGGLLLGRVEQLTGIVRQFAGCFTDHRDPDRIEHPLDQLIMQRVFGLAKNKRLLRAIGKQMHEAKEACEKDGKASRVFTDLDYRTRKSWSRPRKFRAASSPRPSTYSGGPASEVRIRVSS